MFGRSKKDPDEPAGPGEDSDTDTPANARADGPWDLGEVERPSDDPRYVDLGGLIVKGRVGFDLQVTTDQGTDQLGAVMFVTEDAAVELRAFAATRSGGLWDEVRGEITEEVERLGGAYEEVDGSFGVEVRMQVPATTPDGEPATQPSRIVGIEGPRWLLRATFMGRAALEPDEDGLLESAVRDVIVVRGVAPMAPRDAIALVLPASAVKVPPDGDGDNGAVDGEAPAAGDDDSGVDHTR